jgi:hypothetical protein
MTLSFLCPHCSHLFEANPEVFGQTCPCTSCGGFFTVPAPSQEGDKGQVYGQQDDLDAIASLREEKESLGKEADGLRERLLTKERECSEVIFEWDALRERAEVSSKAHKQLETDFADSQKALLALRSELGAANAALKIAEAGSKEAAKSVGLLEQKLRDAEVLQQRLNGAVERIEVLTAECAKGAKELDAQKLENSAIQTEMRTLHERREALLVELKQSNLQGAQSASRLNKSEQEAQVLRSKVAGLSGAEEQSKNAELRRKEAEEKLAEFLRNERSRDEKFQQQERGIEESRTRIAELEAALARSKSDCEVLRIEAQKKQDVVQQRKSASEISSDNAKDSARLLERISELETRLSEAIEKETTFARQLVLKGEELAVMHHRLLQSDHGDRSVPHFGGVFSDTGKRLHELLAMVDRQIEVVFNGYASWDRPYRLAVSVSLCLGLGTLLAWGGWLGLTAIGGGRLQEAPTIPRDLVYATPVVREIQEVVSKENNPEPVVQETGAVPLESSDASPQASSAGSGSGRAPEPAASPAAQAGASKMESEGSDAPTGSGSADSAASKAPGTSVTEKHEGKESIKNLSRASLPNHFLGTQFGTALADVANLAHWTESNGRLRRKATLVGAPVEAVLIPDNENRVMAGAYVRVCPRSTESLAPFLEWAVGVQDAVDAEYGEPSSVHEVSEADDAAAVVERIANGKDFYEATWEREGDDGFIVLSIRIFNERSVVFRLEYLNRQLLSQFTAQQRNAAQAEPGVSPDN